MALTTTIITGVNGFVGNHLVTELMRQKRNIIGVGRESKTGTALNQQSDSYLCVDLLDQTAVETIPFNNVSSVIHLAGLAAVGPSFNQPVRYIHDNAAMLVNLAEAALKQGASPRFVIISSGAVYSSSQPMPLNESSQIGFTSPYAVSKIAVENLAAYYTSRGLEMVVVRPFNHIGPGQSEGFLLPDLTKQVRESIANGSYEIKVGNLSTSRDYTDVRDVVKAYALLATKKTIEPGIYNVCSGKAVVGEEILRLLAEKLLSNEAGRLKITVDPAKVRPVDAQEIIGDNTKLRKATNWQPSYTIDQTIADFILK